MIVRRLPVKTDCIRAAWVVIRFGTGCPGMRFSRGWFLLLALTLSPACLHSQTTASDSARTAPSFQSKVSAVMVDVVVRNGKDEPVTGLDKKDFRVLEEGKPQTISAFEEHKNERTKPARLLPMPPDVHTNFPPVQSTGAVNVLLLDALNTRVSDQAYVRLQLIRYLTTVPPGTPLAVFVLTSRLRMIQAVTTDASVLLAALDDKRAAGGPQQSLLLISPVEADSDQQQNVQMMSSLSAETELAINAMTHRAQNELNLLQIETRISTTLEAMQELARYLAGIAGRKNVVWFSNSFPISIFPNMNTPDQFTELRQFEEQVRRTAALLTAAQVAIYPIAAEGLAPDSLYEADSAKISETRASQVSQDLSDTRDRNSNYLSMEILAESSGGKAFYSTNGLKDALARAIDYGSHYYTLTYLPTDKKMDGKYRRIVVKLSDGKDKLAYRRGYYADNAKDATGRKEQEAGDPLLPLMKRGLPDLAQIIYKIRVVPADPQPLPGAARTGDSTGFQGPFIRFGVDFAVALEDLKLEANSDGLHSGKIEVMLVAYDRDGKALNLVVRKPEIALQNQSYDAAQTAGVQLHYEIDVPRDAFTRDDVYLRAGIYDLRSTHAGTLEIPLRASAQTVTAK
jgi:VWFA-related protein